MTSEQPIVVLKPQPSVWRRFIRLVIGGPQECRVSGCSSYVFGGERGGICEPCQIKLMAGKLAPPNPKPDPLPEFTLRAVCPKCGDAIEKMRYCRYACIHTCIGYVTPVQLNIPVAPEHIHRTCNRCGYEWLTQTKDADPAPVIDRTYLRGDPPPPPKNLKIRKP